MYAQSRQLCYYKVRTLVGRTWEPETWNIKKFHELAGMYQQEQMHYHEARLLRVLDQKG